MDGKEGVEKKGSILRRIDSEDLTNHVKCESRLECTERRSRVDLSGNSGLSKRHSQCKGPEAWPRKQCSKNSQEATVMEQSQ